jgi:ketosteroid isomerase-like protein
MPFEPETRAGIEAFSSITDRLDETIRALRMEVERFIDAGDRVVVMATKRGHGSASGVEVERWHGSISTIRDGMAVRFEWFHEPNEALEAVRQPDLVGRGLRVRHEPQLRPVPFP